MSNPKTQERKVILELNRVKKLFPIKRKVQLRALDDISFQIYQGEKFGVVGESGCGKSTLGRVILQLYPPSGGSCIYYGKSLEELSPAYVEKEIQKLPQYRKNAREFDQKYRELTAQARSLEQQGGDAAKLRSLEQQAEEARKNANRQLREGSRTAGSMILSGKLEEVQGILTKAHQATKQAVAARKTLSGLEAELHGSQGKDTSALEKSVAAARETVDRTTAERAALREQLWAYRGSDYEMVSDRCADPAYLAKLDQNFETGINLSKLTTREMRSLRRDMQMIFQDPAASLDPRQSVGKAIEEVFQIHTQDGPALRKQKVMELLERVGLKQEHYYSYPHALSGGQKQRVGIARAIALGPQFVVLDESVSALDVSVQAQILQLLDELCKEYNLIYFFITHDLGVVKHFCDRILVMYLGCICELADSKALFASPRHPYTRSLLDAVPRPVVKEGERYEENVLEGEVPSAVNPPSGCPFHTRCRECVRRCVEEKPELREVAPGHFVACHLHDASIASPVEEEDA